MFQKIDFAIRCSVSGIAVGLVLVGSSAALGQDAKQKLFERVFGEAAKLDPAMVAKVKATKPGERTFVDWDQDGTNEEVWYIDTAARHQAKAKPLLVRVIDEDGDLDSDKGPDLDSDLYVADWKADGTVDVVIDYQDNDGDNDLDEMGMYYFVGKYAYLGGGPGLLVWWGRDVGDDNLLWYDVNWNYHQTDCQWRCHFSGDEVFLQFGLTEDAKEWRSIFENPFAFYDPDGDDCAEVVIRLSGRGDLVEALRYSFDADDDAFGRRVHDYDFSITALGAGRYLKGVDAAEVRYPESITKGMKLRGIPTQRWVQVEHAQPFAIGAPWDRVLLTWDEMNANTDEKLERSAEERWEGILNHSSKDFPQVGGPPCGRLNKRNEVSFKPHRPLKLYYDPTDRRLHLKGAGAGWLDVDFDLDGKVDAKYTYVDADEDGFFDRRRLDLDADGKVEFDWAMKGQGALELELEWNSVSGFYKPALQELLADSQVFIEAAKAGLAAGTETCPVDPVESYFLTKLESWHPRERLGLTMRKTPAGARLYVDLLRDRLFHSLQKKFGNHRAWAEVEGLYCAGDYKSAGLEAGKEFSPKQLRPWHAFRSYATRIPVRFDNLGGDKRVDWPVTIAVKDLKAAAADFNPENCAVVAGAKWIDWREIPHQVDEVDPSVGKELSFLIDVDAAQTETYFVYYSPEGKSVSTFPQKTDTAEDWVPPNIGWESNRVAYRAYWGQFDFFGKKVDGLIYGDIGNKSYHSEVEWGIDGLSTGKTSGIGGLTLYAGDKGYAVQNPVGKGNVKFAKRRLTKGPVRAGVEILASNVLPDKPEARVRMLCLVYAERQETEICVSVSGVEGGVVLAPGFTKLLREQTFGDPQAGYFGAWGFQEPVIDEIGMGLIVFPEAYVDWVDLPDERQVKLETADGKLRYWLIGDWRRGRRHPVAATASNWEKELAGLASLLLNDVRVAIGQREKAQ